ncbi:MAG: hypothetical protein ACYC6M_16550 [Terriglobales bacterium]
MNFVLREDDDGMNSVLREAAEVLLILRQDLAQVVKPRLAALGANTKRFHTMGNVPDGSEKNPTMRPFRASTDLAHLDAFLERTPDVKLVLIDPLELFLDQGNRSFLTQILRELGDLAARRGVAIVAAARAPEMPGANNLRRWLDKLAGVEELGTLLAVVRDRRRPARRYLAAVKNTLADTEDALTFETPGGRIAWGRGGVSAAVLWATATRLDQEDAARFLRDELALGPKTAKELRAAADEAGFPWHVVYRAKGIAGADCGRVGGGAGSYFVWDLVTDGEPEPPVDVARSGTRESSDRLATLGILTNSATAKSSIENAKTGPIDRSPLAAFAARSKGPASTEHPARNAPPQASGTDARREHTAAEPERAAAPSAGQRDDAQKHAKSSIENAKTGDERGRSCLGIACASAPATDTGPEFLGETRLPTAQNRRR